MPDNLVTQLIACGLKSSEAAQMSQCVSKILKTNPSHLAWQKISKSVLNPKQPFALHRLLFSLVYPDWLEHPETAPAWSPDPETLQQTHLAKIMREQHFPDYRTFHTWSIENRETFWQSQLKNLHIIFKKDPEKICDMQKGIEHPIWFPHAKMNIADSCFQADPNKPAMIFYDEANCIKTMSYAELNRLTNRIANSLLKHGFKPKDAIAIDMPMTEYAVAIYLGIIKMGGMVISIADSFSKEEIATRLSIANAKGVFTQDFIVRQTKKIPLYEKVVAANAPTTIVLQSMHDQITLRKGDAHWNDFLVSDESFESYAESPMTTMNILFSSGTTGTPKAIPWNHTTPIKVASDAYLHQDIRPEDVLLWPTSLGWMMGPWVLFAALMNQATLALYTGIPREKAFGEFVEKAKVTMLGVVPTLVAYWRQSDCMKGFNWETIRVFSSTGESSNPEDMLYLMSLAHYKPIIEYCGGTEIGGAYVTSTLVENNYLSLCTTPAMGLDFVLLDENGKSADEGEVAIIPPSIGLSTELLNANQHQVYYADMPIITGKTLRRHGDHLKRYENGLYSILGRVDDTMNLGAIKVSSVEIERVLSGLKDINETAAIAVSPLHSGPSQLVIFVATEKELSKNKTRDLLQQRINQHLNPLFKIHDVVFLKELPKTASNKIMRRVLRNQYQPS